MNFLIFERFLLIIIHSIDKYSRVKNYKQNSKCFYENNIKLLKTIFSYLFTLQYYNLLFVYDLQLIIIIYFTFLNAFTPEYDRFLILYKFLDTCEYLLLIKLR